MREVFCWPHYRLFLQPIWNLLILCWLHSLSNAWKDCSNSLVHLCMVLLRTLQFPLWTCRYEEGQHRIQDNKLENQILVHLSSKACQYIFVQQAYPMLFLRFPQWYGRPSFLLIHFSQRYRLYHDLELDRELASRQTLPQRSQRARYEEESSIEAWRTICNDRVFPWLCSILLPKALHKVRHGR